jgi:hypothetical protein
MDTDRKTKNNDNRHRQRGRKRSRSENGKDGRAVPEITLGNDGNIQEEEGIIEDPNWFKPNIEVGEKNTLRTLWWNSPVDNVPFASEVAMIEVLLRWKKKERGMMKTQPPFRLRIIKDELNRVGNITLLQALSLRRHHIKELNRKISMSRLGLGHESDVRKSAAIFEECVEDFLKKCRVEFWTEQDLKIMFNSRKNQEEKLAGTPDFFLKRQIVLRKVKGARVNCQQILEEKVINWIEAKMFFGASTIPQGSPGAVGSIIGKLTKYVQAYGPGAIVFMNGCGDRLSDQLAEIGVTTLDCSGTVNLGRVRSHQRSWCSNDNGQILN